MDYRDPPVLRRHVRRIIDFYHPACIDSERGCYLNQFTDTDRYYWVLAETVAAAALLATRSQASRTRAARYWDWYDRAWEYADRCFVDHQYGAWYRVLDRSGRRYDDKKSPPSETDYHPLGACYEILRAIG